MLKKIRSLVLNSNPSFIEVYDNALTKKECGILISCFDDSKDVLPGKTSGGYQPEIKKCLELSCDFRNKSIVTNIIRPTLCKYIDSYADKYVSLDVIHKWKYFPRYNFQKYEKESDGYKGWHTEHGPDGESRDRIMAWMFYLNNAESGTDFLHYQTLRAKMGRLVIWPASWTHLHRSHLNKGFKYIITGWISFIEGEYKLPTSNEK